MKTFIQKPAAVQKSWILIDAQNTIPGRLASFVANRLRGKHKPTFTPHVDDGDNVIIINAAKIKFSGKKYMQKKYHHHTGFPGGIKTQNAKTILEGKFPTRIMEKAVERMMPKGPLARQQLKNLYIYADETHKHEAQKPTTINFAKINTKNTNTKNKRD